MSEKGKNIWIVVLCGVIAVSLGLGFRAVKNAGGREGVNPNVVLVTAPEQEDFEVHPDWTIPVTEPVDYGENLAAGKKVAQNGQTQTYNCRNVNDGDRTTYWEGASNNYPNMLTFDLEQKEDIGAVRILLNPRAIWSARTQDVEIQVSDDGEEFATVMEKTTLSFDPMEDNSVYLPLEASGQYVRFLFHDNTGAKAGQAAEIEIYPPQD